MTLSVARAADAMLTAMGTQNAVDATLLPPNLDEHGCMVQLQSEFFFCLCTFERYSANVNL